MGSAGKGLAPKLARMARGSPRVLSRCYCARRTCAAFHSALPSRGAAPRRSHGPHAAALFPTSLLCTCVVLLVQMQSTADPAAQSAVASGPAAHAQPQREGSTCEQTGGILRKLAADIAQLGYLSDASLAMEIGRRYPTITKLHGSVSLRNRHFTCPRSWA